MRHLLPVAGGQLDELAAQRLELGGTVGCGTLSVQPLIYRLVCKNGLIASDHALRKTHVGRSLTTEAESVHVFRDDTLAADDRAFFLKVAVSVVLPTPPLVLVMVNLIIDSVPIQVRH